MTVKEMHIEFNQAVQKIGANSTRKAYPEEVDWLLNKAMERFIQSKVKPKKDGSGGFEVDQMDLDAIRPLLTNAKIPARVVDADNGYYSAQLPGDYAYLISDDSLTEQLCGNPLPALKNNNVHYFTVYMSPYTAGSAPFFGYVGIFPNTGSGKSLADIADYNNQFFAGYPSKDQVFMLTNPILLNLKLDAGIEVYWERYAGVYKPKTFFLIMTADFNSIISNDGDGSNLPGDDWNFSYYTRPTTKGKWVPNRLSRTDKVSTLLVTPYYKSSHLSPISELQGDQLLVYGDNSSFIVSTVNVDYVRKHRRIELILGQDCELAPEFHPAVCDLAAEYFKAMIADTNGWEIKMKDNLLRSPNT